MAIRFISTALSLLLTFPLAAQMAEQRAVEGVISKLFRGIEKGDSAMVSSSFNEDIEFVTIFKDRNNVPVFEKETSPHDFLNAIGTPHKQSWYEEVWDLSIRIDGNFAQAWCNYAFYLDNTFSHCGVDAFQLYKGTNGWKIFYLTDTRRKDPCIVPEAIKSRHQ